MTRLLDLFGRIFGMVTLCKSLAKRCSGCEMMCLLFCLNNEQLDLT